MTAVFRDHNGMQIITTTTIKCPECGYQAKENMPTNACQWFYDCRGCKRVLRPLPGDCCVFCSYGADPCPPIQEGDACCSGPVP